MYSLCLATSHGRFHDSNFSKKDSISLPAAGLILITSFFFYSNVSFLLIDGIQIPVFNKNFTVTTIRFTIYNFIKLFLNNSQPFIEINFCVKL